MKVVAGVDWSDASFAAVEQVGLLYRPEEVVIVHGVDLGLFQSPMMAQAANLQGYDEFRRAMIDAGRTVVERAKTLLPPDIPSVVTRCEVEHAARFIVAQAQAEQADLVVVGTHDRSRVTELFVGSVSHHVLLHGGRSTLIVKGKARRVARVLVAVEGREDAGRLQAWMAAHSFRTPAALTVLCVVPSLPMMDPHPVIGLQHLLEDSLGQAETMVQDIARGLTTTGNTASGLVRTGDPVTAVCEAARDYDLLMVGSHGRTGLGRFLLGSVSHGIVHRAGVSVLVVR